MFFWFIKGISSPLGRILYRTKVYGAENIPRTGPFMLVGNHQSNLDPVFLATGNPRRLYAMGKSELFENPISRWFYLHLGAFPIHRGKPDRAGLKKIIDLFNRGNAVIVFPEGGRNREPGLGPMEPGIVFLADIAGVPILPVGITGSGKIFPKGAKRPGFPKVTVRYGQLFWLDDIAPRRPNMSAAEKKERQDLLLKAVSGRIKQLSDDAF